VFAVSFGLFFVLPAPQIADSVGARFIDIAAHKQMFFKFLSTTHEAKIKKIAVTYHEPFAMPMDRSDSSDSASLL
jgi:hypothetical protein